MHVHVQVANRWCDGGCLDPGAAVIGRGCVERLAPDFLDTREPVGMALFELDRRIVTGGAMTSLEVVGQHVQAHLGAHMCQRLH